MNLQTGRLFWQLWYNTQQYVMMLVVAAALNDETIEFHSFLLLLGGNGNEPRRLLKVIRSQMAYSTDVNILVKGLLERSIITRV